MARCPVCGNRFAPHSGDAELPLILFLLGIFSLVIGILGSSGGFAFVGLVLILVGIWTTKTMGDPNNCPSRPAQGQPCPEAYNMPPGKERDRYWNMIRLAQAQGTYNQRRAWESRGEDPHWETFDKDYPDFRKGRR